jgi:hypothetical protein
MGKNSLGKYAILSKVVLNIVSIPILFSFEKKYERWM